MVRHILPDHGSRLSPPLTPPPPPRYRVLANYMLWRAVGSSVSYLSLDARDARLKFHGRVFGRTEHKPRWKECLNGAISRSVREGDGGGRRRTAPRATGSQGDGLDGAGCCTMVVTADTRGMQWALYHCAAMCLIVGPVCWLLNPGVWSLCKLMTRQRSRQVNLGLCTISLHVRYLKSKTKDLHRAFPCIKLCPYYS